MSPAPRVLVLPVRDGPVAERSPPAGDGARGLSTLRRLGAVSDLLFLYEAETRPAGQLRTIAAQLGLSVQAASHSFRSLRHRGLAEYRDGRYRPTVRGVDWLHAALGSVRDDLAERLDRLHIVRTTCAIAAAPVADGEGVRLEIVDGLLTARPGAGSGSRGRAFGAARAGELVDVGELEGIVPLPVGRLRIVCVPADRLRAANLGEEVRDALAAAPDGPLLAYGLEACHLLDRLRPGRPVGRFGVAAAAQEASRLGVASTLVVVDRALPRLLAQFTGTEVPPFEFLPLRGAAPPAPPVASPPAPGRPSRRPRRRTAAPPPRPDGGSPGRRSRPLR